ncbi:MAG: hypothetical protein IKG27_03525 [Bacilli bacterium]|nr:hypothetical protein [Bacilli bacterium]
MITRDELLEKLENDVTEIEDKINNPEKHNIKNAIIRKFLKTGIAIDYALPYILSAIILFSGFKNIHQTPFYTDDIITRQYLELVDTSNGKHMEEYVDAIDEISYIEYSTAWQENEYGLYERISTTYMLNDLNIGLETILNMSPEELDQCFSIYNAEIVVEDNPNALDPTYNDEIVIVTRVFPTNRYTDRKETIISNSFFTIFYLIMTFLLGRGIQEVKKIVFHDYLKNNLERLEVSYQEIDEEKIKKLNEILELKKENLELVKERKVNNGQKR